MSSSYTSGPEILKGKKYPSKQHASKVVAHLTTKNPSVDLSSTLFFLSGEDMRPLPYCDQAFPFRQGRYFYYLSGCNIAGSHVLYEPSKEKLTLFLPDFSAEDAMWSGMPMDLETLYKTFDADEILYVKDIDSKLESLKDFKIFSTAIDDFSKKYKEYLIPEDEAFMYALDESRLIKDEFELLLMRHAAKITDNSHLAVMSLLPIEKNEGHIHAEFTYHSIRQGSKAQSYDPICCSGPNCGTLHYVKNDEDLGNRNSILIDAGAEWSNYASDVTRCFPVTGEWTKEHLEIYEIVLDMQSQTMAKILPGVLWDDLHFLLHKILIKHFLKLGIFKSDFSEEEIFDSKVSASFFPHGLGHLMGMDTHDVGGHANYDDPNQMLRYLRLRRPLQAGMVVTDEPGCYFSPLLIEEALKDPKKASIINMDVLKKYYPVGGVRIEDDIIVTETGYENMTGITSDPHEILKIVSDGIAKGRSHFHVIV